MALWAREVRRRGDSGFTAEGGDEGAWCLVADAMGDPADRFTPGELQTLRAAAPLIERLGQSLL